MSEQLLWPAGHLDEVRAGIDPYTEIVSYFHAPWQKERYTESGWRKMQEAQVDVRDFGVVPNGN